MYHVFFEQVAAILLHLNIDAKTDIDCPVFVRACEIIRQIAQPVLFSGSLDSAETQTIEHFARDYVGNSPFYRATPERVIEFVEAALEEREVDLVEEVDAMVLEDDYDLRGWAATETLSCIN